MKLVLDTNIFISGLLFPKSNPGKLLKMCFEGNFELCLSNEIITEIEKEERVRFTTQPPSTNFLIPINYKPN